MELVDEHDRKRGILLKEPASAPVTPNAILFLALVWILFYDTQDNL